MTIAASKNPVPAENIMDWDAAVKRLAGRSELLKEMARMFTKETGKRLPEIRQAIDQGDMQTLRRVAHLVKGSADCFSARFVVAVALRLEFMGRDGSLIGANEAFADLVREIERLKPVLAARTEVGLASDKSDL